MTQIHKWPKFKNDTNSKMIQIQNLPKFINVPNSKMTLTQKLPKLKNYPNQGELRSVIAGQFIKTVQQESLARQFSKKIQQDSVTDNLTEQVLNWQTLLFRGLSAAGAKAGVVDTQTLDDPSFIYVLGRFVLKVFYLSKHFIGPRE